VQQSIETAIEDENYPLLSKVGSGSHIRSALSQGNIGMIQPIFSKILIPTPVGAKNSRHSHQSWNEKLLILCIGLGGHRHLRAKTHFWLVMFFSVSDKRDVCGSGNVVSMRKMPFNSKNSMQGN